jgi:hypothetical protein
MNPFQVFQSCIHLIKFNPSTNIMQAPQARCCDPLLHLFLWREVLFHKLLNQMRQVCPFKIKYVCLLQNKVLQTVRASKPRLYYFPRGRFKAAFILPLKAAAELMLARRLQGAWLSHDNPFPRGPVTLWCGMLRRKWPAVTPSAQSEKCNCDSHSKEKR